MERAEFGRISATSQTPRYGDKKMKIENRQVVVTGGAGFIGSHVVDRLVEKGNTVIVVDDFSTGRKENLLRHQASCHVTIEQMDICNLDGLSKVMRGADVVFHLAVANLRACFRNPQRVHEVNATGTLNVCRAAEANHVKRLVYVSSSEVYGSATNVPMTEEHPLRPTTVYGASKLAGEVYARAFWYTYGLPVTVIRPFNTYGPREHYSGNSAEVIPRFVLRIMSGARPVIFGDGEQTRDFTWVLDTANGILMAAEHDQLVGDCVNIARGHEVSINDLCSIVIRILGKSNLQPVNIDKGRPGDVRRHFADIRKARCILGFEPSTDIQQGIQKYVDWFTKQDIDIQKWASDQYIFNWEI